MGILTTEDSSTTMRPHRHSLGSTNILDFADDCAGNEGSGDLLFLGAQEAIQASLLSHCPIHIPPCLCIVPSHTALYLPCLSSLYSIPALQMDIRAQWLRISHAYVQGLPERSFLAVAPQTWGTLRMSSAHVLCMWQPGQES